MADTVVDDTWHEIFNYCDRVQLHALYCTSVLLSRLVDKKVRKTLQTILKIKAAGMMDDFGKKMHYNAEQRQQLQVGALSLIYLSKFTPVPGILFYQPTCVETGKFDNIIDDLFYNLSESLINWYGANLIRKFLNITLYGSKGLGCTMKYGNDKSDSEVLEIIKLIQKYNVVPTVIEKYKGSANEHLLALLVKSGRYEVLSTLYPNLEIIEKENNSDKCTINMRNHQILKLSILSGRVEMLKYVHDCLEIKIEEGYVELALKVNDDVFGYVVSSLSTAPEVSLIGETVSRNSHLPTILDRAPESTGNLGSRIFCQLFTEEEEDDEDLTIEILDRAFRYVKVSVYELLGEFYRAWDCDMNNNLMIVLKWLINRQILTQESMIEYLKPLILTTVSIRSPLHKSSAIAVKECQCGGHRLARELIERGYLLDIELQLAKEDYSDEDQYDGIVTAHQIDDSDQESDISHED